MNFARTLAACALGLLAACASTESDARDPWAPDFDPPHALDTERVHLEPLRAEHAESDYAALMSSAEHLRSTLGWGDWPRDDFTVAENRSDLEIHQREFERRRSYAFTVQSADRSHCVGCVYLDPLRDEDRDAATPRDPRAVLLEFWVVAAELPNQLDAHLLTSVLRWLDREWPFTVVYVPVRGANARGTALARDLGLVEAPEVRIRDTIAWRRAP